VIRNTLILPCKRFPNGNISIQEKTIAVCNATGKKSGIVFNEKFESE